MIGHGRRSGSVSKTTAPAKGKRQHATILVVNDVEEIRDGITLLLTSDALIAEKPKEGREKGAAGGGGDSDLY